MEITQFCSWKIIILKERETSCIVEIWLFKLYFWQSFCLSRTTVKEENTTFGERINEWYSKEVVENKMEEEREL